MPQIGRPGTPVSHISQAYADRVEVRGRDLATDLMGRLGFTEYFHLLLTGDEPTEDQRFFLDLLLVLRRLVAGEQEEEALVLRRLEIGRRVDVEAAEGRAGILPAKAAGVGGS